MDTLTQSRAVAHRSPENASPPQPIGWARAPIARIEDLSDAVYGAGLRAVQMSAAPVNGSLVFAECGGVTYSSGYLGGRVELIGPLSETQVTIGAALSLAPGTRHWMHEVASGDMGLFMPGDEHDALYYPGSLYAAITLSDARAEELGARLGRVIDVRKLGGSSVLPQRIAAGKLQELRAGFMALHAGGSVSMHAADALLVVLLENLGRLPRPIPARMEYPSRARIVQRCREYLEAHMSEDLSLESLALATGTSTRTLFRSFTEVLGETPLHYIRRRRLHRIREDLRRPGDAGDTVTAIATRWGVSELGRFAGRYRDLFGEYPSQTRAQSFRPEAALAN